MLFVEFFGWNAKRAHQWMDAKDAEAVMTWEEGLQRGLLSSGC